ncbi:MAG TPA: wax ester/triacylglycerol synthase family O-acyltransferase [Acidimicrobiales bacterium]|nr:wax ester/triacylglycerol synthase family O-acyltransferase [Acidimicrobiales bacterium]
MQRLTGFDAAFFHLETAGTHMHVGQTCVFDPSTAPRGHSFERIRQLIHDRLHLVPPFRRRLADIPMRLHHPVWLEDPDFDLDYHVRSAALPQPGGVPELADFTAEVMGRPLHRDRPPWEMYIVEGLEDGMVAGVTKVHHAAIDGLSGAEITATLLDLSPEQVTTPPEGPWEPDRVSPFELGRAAIGELARQPRTVARLASRTVGSALALRRRNRSEDTAPPPAPFSAPRTSLQTAISAHRRIAFAEVSLDKVKTVKNTLGGTVNDVILTMCAGALRSLLAARGEHPERSLVAAVPVSVRSEEQRGTMGNQISAMLVSLASTVENPVERLRAISAGSAQAKAQDKVFGVQELSEWTEILSPGVVSRAARMASRLKVLERLPPLFNVIVSNFPGPAFPLYFSGSRMLAAYPMGPVTDGGPLNITVQSYMGTLFFGLVACRDAVPEVWDIAQYLDDTLNELSKAAAKAGPGGRSSEKAGPGGGSSEAAAPGGRRRPTGSAD